MQTIDARIASFLEDNHVLALATCWAGKPWAANGFYLYDDSDTSLVIQAAHDTWHGGTLPLNPSVAGCIAGQALSVDEILGVQFSGTAKLIPMEELESAQRAFYCRFPSAIAMAAPLWRIALNHLKLTDNRLLGFGGKLVWRREAVAA